MINDYMQVQDKHCMVFRNEKNGRVQYTISSSSKDLQGNYTNQTFQVNFGKNNTPPEDRSIIEFEGFMTYYKSPKNNRVYTTIQITSWNYQGEEPTVNNTSDDIFDNPETKFKEEDDPFFNSSNINIDDDDLPF